MPVILLDFEKSTVLLWEQYIYPPQKWKQEEKYTVFTVLKKMPHLGSYSCQEKNKKNNVSLSISVHIYLYPFISSSLNPFIYPYIVSFICDIAIYYTHILYTLYPYPCIISIISTYIQCVYIPIYIHFLPVFTSLFFLCQLNIIDSPFLTYLHYSSLVLFYPFHVLFLYSI